MKASDEEDGDSGLQARHATPALGPGARPGDLGESERIDDAWVRADEAITRLGEELSALGIDLTDDRFEIAIRHHVEDALHSYEQAKRGLKMAATRQTQLATAETWIKDGEYHPASVNAILTGAPEPAPPEGHRLHRPR